MNSKVLSVFASLFALVGMMLPAAAADIVYQEPSIDLTDPTPVAAQKPAVDGINFKASLVTSVLGGYSNHMLVASVAAPVPYFSNFGVQLDGGIGQYRHDYMSGAAGLHIFYRNPDKGLIGIYGDYAYVNPEHAGRVGVETSLYKDRWTLDAFAGVQFGQHVLTKFVDEVDLSYYFTDNFKGSIGHRLISRGHVANIGFEYMPEASNGWSLYGEAEAGEDNYTGAFVGVRYAFGQGSANTLIDRDRTADPIVRIPRNLASVTRCGDIANPANWHDSWNGFKFEKKDNLCGSKNDLNDYGAVEGKK